MINELRLTIFDFRIKKIRVPDSYRDVAKQITTQQINESTF